MRAVTLLALVFAGACSSVAPPTGPAGTADADGGVVSADAAADASFGGDPYVTVTSDGGSLKIAVRTDPQPPPRGTCTAEVTVTDASGAPQDGLTLSIVPWMAAMGHGSSVRPSVAPLGRGKYLVTNVNLFMPGNWELRMSISGPVTDHAAPVLVVP